MSVSVPVLGSAPLFASTSAVSLPLPKLFAPLSTFAVSVLVPRSSALLSVSPMSVLVPELSAPPSVSALSVPVLGSSAPPSMSVVFILGPGLSPPPFPTWSSLQTTTLILERRKLGQWSGIIKKASSEESPPTFALLFPPSKRASLLLFPFSNIGKNGHLIRFSTLTIGH